MAACIYVDTWGYHLLQTRSCESLPGSPHDTDSTRSIPVPPLNFIRINFVENMSARFGVHAWHWHITQVGWDGVGSNYDDVWWRDELSGP